MKSCLNAVREGDVVHFKLGSIIEMYTVIIVDRDRWFKNNRFPSTIHPISAISTMYMTKIIKAPK